MMLRSFFIFLPLTFLLLAGCAKNNSSSAPDFSVQIRGNVIDSLVQGGNVTAYSFNTGQIGEVLGSAQTDTQGLYSLTIKSYSGPVYLELRGGTYVDEATGAVTSLTRDQFLSAIKYIEGGKDIGSLMITPLTTIAAKLAGARINSGKSIFTAIDEANNDVTHLFGINILTTYPLNLTGGLTSFSDSAHYGLILAGLSQMAAQISEFNGVQPGNIYPSIKVADAMAIDASDGILDGKENGQQIFLGSYPLDSYSYRSKLGQAAILFLSNPNNRSGLGWNDVITALNTTASVTNIFPAGDLPKPVDETPPTITLIPQNNTAVNKTVTVTAHAADLSGIASLTLTPGILITPQSEGQKGDISTYVYIFDSTKIPDGDVTFTATAADRAGNQAQASMTLRVFNTPPVLNMTLLTGSWVNQPMFNITGTVKDNSNLGMASVVVGPVTATVTTSTLSGTAPATFTASVPLIPGNNPVDIVATDKLGNTTTIKGYTLILDNTPPTVSVNPTLYFDETQMTFSFQPPQINYSTAGAIRTTVDAANAVINKNQARLSIGTGGINTLNLNSMNLPYYSISVNDSGYPSTPFSQLQVFYSFSQKKTNDSAYVVIKDFSPAVIDSSNTAGNGYLIPIAEETLDPILTQTDPSTLNRIQIKAIDGGGNVTYQDLIFSINLFPPPLYLAEDPAFPSASAQDRTSLYFYHFGVRSSLYIAGNVNVGKINISNFSPVKLYLSTSFTQNTSALTVGVSAIGTGSFSCYLGCYNIPVNKSYVYPHALTVNNQFLFNSQTNNPLPLQPNGFYQINPGETVYYWVQSSYSGPPVYNDIPPYNYPPLNTCYRTDTSLNFSHGAFLSISSMPALLNNVMGNNKTLYSFIFNQYLYWPGNPDFSSIQNNGTYFTNCLP